MLLIENLLYRDQIDHAAGFFVEGGALVLGVGGEAEGDKEAALAILAGHSGVRGVLRGHADPQRVPVFAGPV